MRTRFITIAAVAASLSLLGAACSSDDSSSTAPAADTTEPAMAAEIRSPTSWRATPTSRPCWPRCRPRIFGDTLAGAGPYTVFAPTDEAFAALPEGTLDTLLDPMNQEQLAGILTYHVVPAEVMAADVTSGEVETVNGATFTVEVTDGTVTITDGQGNEAQVVQTDIVASNGVIHVIDAVLLPPA